MTEKGQYDFFTSKVSYTFFKAIYNRKRISFEDLVADSNKSKGVVSRQLKPLVDKHVIEYEAIGQKYYYKVNEAGFYSLISPLDIVNVKSFPYLDVYVYSAENFKQLKNLIQLILEAKKEMKNNRKAFDFQDFFYKTLWK